MIRLFVGIEMDEETADALAGLAGGLAGARWVEAHNLHLTLRFIGEVDESQAEDLHRALAKIHLPAFAIAFGEFGTFGGRKPRALWLGVQLAPELTRLQAKTEQAAVEAGLAPETRRFTPHVTLARLNNAPAERLAQIIIRHSPLRLPPMAVDHLTLFQSHLGRNGAEYEAIARYPLYLASETPA